MAKTDDLRIENLTPKEWELVQWVTAWMQSKDREISYRQECISCCWGSCGGEGRYVFTCLMGGCCPGMEEHFPAGYSQEEVAKRWRERSLWRKIRGLPPKLVFSKAPKSYREYQAKLPPFAAVVIEKYIRYGFRRLTAQEKAYFSGLPAKRRRKLERQHETYKRIGVPLSSMERKVGAHFESIKHRRDHVPFSFIGEFSNEEVAVLLTTRARDVPDLVKRRFVAYKRGYIRQAKEKLPEAIEAYVTNKHSWVADIRGGKHGMRTWHGVWLYESQRRCLELLTQQEKQLLIHQRNAYVTELKRGRQQLARLITYYAENKLGVLLQEFQRASAVGGLQIFAPSGWGKSILLGALCAQNAKRGIATVVLDVSGATTANALDLLARIGGEEGARIEEKIRYCNMAGEEVNGQRFVPSWPILGQHFTGEDLYTTSQRFIDLIAKTDKAFAEAPIMGLARMRPLLTSIATVLSVLGLPLVRAYDLLKHPENWEERLTRAAAHPDATEAVTFLREEFFNLPPATQEVRSEPLRNRLYLLRFNPVARAMFANEAPLIAWETVAREGQQVYIDLSREQSDDAREFKFFWVWQSLLVFRHEGFGSYDGSSTISG